MSTDLKPLQDYIHAVERELARGNATEHTHRPALKALVESFSLGITATNEPRHIECGAPDFVVSKGVLTVGYIEAKDIGKSLDEAEKSEQLKRYCNSLSNLILTDYLEFRWYIDGKKRESARVGTVTKDGKIKRDKSGIQDVGNFLSNFLLHKAEAVGTPKDLALQMAHLTHMIRDLIIKAFEKEPEAGSLHTQLTAFRDNLIPDLSTEYFADMYAQTIAYGLFAARCTHPEDKNFTRQNAAYLLPKTNPFLRKLFNIIAGPELDDRIAWLVDDLAQVLAQADMKAVLNNFGKHSGKEDPVVHFYETFLKAYDSKIREMRGVYYTPEPVVSYIVRSINYLLKTRFNKLQGLSDPSVYILDPATGTATFLYMVINEIRQTFAGQEGMWNDYVTNKLLKRLFGFELLMAPYAVAHLKLGLLLQETGYQFQSNQRLGIYLTNTMEEVIKHSETLFAQWITEEANAAAEIKKEKPIMVVLGNPPYSGISANASIRTITNPKTGKPKQELTWIGKLIQDYKVVDGKPLNERKHWLQDDYVKFIRFGQWRIERTRQGILGFITNHGYLDNPTFRGMRQSLMNTFTDIYILNLHGNVKRKEITADGGKDDNVFDIQQGVAICLFVKEPDKTNPAKVHYADMWGTQDSKYHALFETDANTTKWVKLTPNTPFYFFVPREEKLRPEYEKGWKVTDIFPLNGVGMVTGRDSMAIEFDSEHLWSRVRDFASLSEEEARQNYDLGKDARDWRVATAQADVRGSGPNKKNVVPILYRPFDFRFTYYTGNSRGFYASPCTKVMRHMLAGQNIGLVWSRPMSPNFAFSVLATGLLVDQCVIGNKLAGAGISYMGPLYLYRAENEMQLGEGHRRANLNPVFIKEFPKKLGLTFIEDGRGDFDKTFGSEDIFHYAYAIFHSPTYRTRYAEFLKIDFPRLPLTSDKELFRVLADKGAELVSLHLMESPSLNKLITKYPVTGSNIVEKVNYNEASERVYINKEQYFEGVPPEVWDLHIGGYQVCQKWLKDRQKDHRTLTYDELTHYQKIVVALKETIRLMAEIDDLIPAWPIE